MSTTRKADVALPRKHKEAGLRTCTQCKELKPVSEFQSYKRSARSYQIAYRCECKPCGKASRSAEKTRAHVVRTRYGLSWEQYTALLTAQDNKCAICHAETPGPARHNWYVDHDHACCPFTGQSYGRACGKCVRGLLCQHCNSALGYARDNVETLKSMIAYLEAGVVKWPAKVDTNLLPTQQL